RRAQTPGAAGDPLPRRRRAGAQSRGDAVSSALGRRQCRTRRSRAGQERGGAARPHPQRRAGRGGQGPDGCGPPAAGPARGPGGWQRLTMARETLDREETRATDRMSELDRRLVQLGDDIERERRLAADAQAAIARLASEEEELQREVKANDERRAGADKR